MKRKSVIRVIINILSILTISAGLILFHLEYGLWWDRPNLGNNILRVELIKGGFVPPGGEYTTVVLTPEDQEFKNIIDLIEDGWRYDTLYGGIKYASYIVEVTHSDGSETIVDIDGKIMRVEKNNDVQIFRSLHDITETFETVFRTKNPNQNMEPMLKTPAE